MRLFRRRLTMVDTHQIRYARLGLLIDLVSEARARFHQRAYMKRSGLDAHRPARLTGRRTRLCTSPTAAGSKRSRRQCCCGAMGLRPGVVLKRASRARAEVQLRRGRRRAVACYRSRCVAKRRPVRRSGDASPRARAQLGHSHAAVSQPGCVEGRVRQVGTVSGRCQAPGRAERECDANTGAAANATASDETIAA